MATKGYGMNGRLYARAMPGIRRALAVWASGLSVLVLVLALPFAGQNLLDRLRNIAFDSYQRIEPRQQAGDAVAIVDIDEASIAEIGQWPWPRDVMARIVDRLGDLGAAAIVFDIVFTDPDRTSPARAVADLRARGAEISLPENLSRLDNDAILAEAFARNPVVAGFALGNASDAPLPPPRAGFAFGGADPKSYLPAFAGGVTNLDQLSAAAAGAGFFSFPTAHDGMVRRLPVVASAQDALYPALSVEALRVAQGAGSYAVRSTNASGETGAGPAGMSALRVGALELPVGPDAGFRVYHSGMPELAWISAAELVGGDGGPDLEAAVAGRIVLVGTSALGLRDLVATPLAGAVPGVRVHAEIIDQILGQSFLGRPDWTLGAEIAGAGLAGLVVLVLVWSTGAILSSVGTLFILAGIATVSWYAFSASQVLVDPILPGLAAVAVFSATVPVRLVMTDKEKRYIRGAFDRYLSPQLVSRLTDNPRALSLGGETRDITVLFSDIRGFTSLSEGLDPESLTTLLNDFLTPCTDVLLRSEATIDKYIGDAIMAMWNAPLDIEAHREKACLAALDMLRALDTLNAETGRDLKIGIGLNAGECCVGNLGSDQRFSYSAIGDNVNIAARVEGLTKHYGVSILVTEDVRAGVADLAFIEADRVRVVGRSRPISIHVLTGGADVARSEEFAALNALHTRFLKAYRSLEINAASTLLGEIQATAPERLRGLYALYEERLASMTQDPPSSDWDGVFEADAK